MDMLARVMSSTIATKAVAPMALALLPGIKRGAFQCKLLFPQSLLFGWIVWVSLKFFYVVPICICLCFFLKVVPIFYVPIIAVLMLMALQLLSSAWLSGCAVLFGASQLYPLAMGTGIAKMYRDAAHFRQAAVMKKVERKATV
jgi:hypothetical protein